MTQTTGKPADATMLHHQFDDLPQQQVTANLGMWIFLVTEVLFFGVLFTGYTVYRILHPAAWVAASRETHLLLGTLNTAILLTSSLTMALAVKAAQLRQQRATIALLLATILLGCCFLGIKGSEYRMEITDHKFPGPTFNTSSQNASDPAKLRGKARADADSSSDSRVDSRDVFGCVSRDVSADGGEQLFFTFYWIMTGVHSVHMLVGVGLLLILASRVATRRSTARDATIIENAGLYWHFVDIVWVFLFPLIYLVGHI